MRCERPDQRSTLVREVLLTKQHKTTNPSTLAQEARRLLAKLAQGAVIEWDAEDCLYFLGVSRTKAAAADTRKPLSRHLVDACTKSDLLRREGNHWILSDAGYALVRRNQAGMEDPFRAQHQLRSQVLCEIDGIRRSVLQNEGESPLGWLRRRKSRDGQPWIGEQQFEAGERLRADYWFAQMSPRVTANWSALAPLNVSRRGAPAHGATLRDDVLAAKNRVVRALAAVGPETSGVLVDICCELKGLEEAEKKNGWPQRAAKVVLQIALTRLAKHYGLLVDEGSRKRRLRHCGDAGYSPRLNGPPEDPNPL